MFADVRHRICEKFLECAFNPSVGEPKVLQREDFVYQVEERLAQVEAEFARLDGGPKGGLEDGEGASKDPAAATPADWIDQVEQETLRQSERSHRDTVLKYIRYILDVARQV